MKQRIGIVWMITGLAFVMAVQGCDKKNVRPAQEKASQRVGVEGELEEGGEQGVPGSEEVKGERKEESEAEVEGGEAESEPESDGESYSVFSFLANRPLAHELHDGAIVEVASDRGFLRTYWGNHSREWLEGKKLEGRAAIVLNKRRDGKMSIPSPVSHPKELSLDVYSSVDNTPNKLRIKLNGTKLQEQVLKKGWNRVVWELTNEGGDENQLEIAFSELGRIDGMLTGGAVGGLRIGEKSATKAEAEGEKEGWLPYGLANGQGALTLKGGQGAVWYVFNVAKTRLKVKIQGEEGCGLKIEAAQTKGKGVKTTQKQQVTVGKQGSGETVAIIDLKGANDRVSRVSATVAEGCAGLTIEKMDLVAEGEKPKRKVFEPPKHILFWMIDTLRSDHVPVHFKTDVVAPNLKRLADEGASFKWGIVQGNESKTSHASVFTGMYPSRHRVLQKGTLKPYHELIQEALQKLGYFTAAYMANGYISKPWGFVQGWNFYRNNLREELGISAAALRKDTEGWMARNIDKKFFMYVGTIDPHVSYRAHKGLIEKYTDADYQGSFKNSCSGIELGKIKSKPESVSEADRKQIHGLYKNEIEYNDQEFGKLRAFMEEKGLWEKTLVVITADHGDEFWEHGSVGHGHSAYGELVHVPIMFYYPPAIDAGVKPETGADALDIYPTLVDIAGGKAVDDVQGESLLPVMDKDLVVYPAPGIGTRYLSHYAFHVNRWKLLIRRGDFALYDAENDVLEQNDVSAANPFETRAVTDGVSWFIPSAKRWQKTTWGHPTNLSAHFLELLNKKDS